MITMEINAFTTLIVISIGQYFLGTSTTPSNRPMYWIWEPIKSRAGAKIVTCIISIVLLESKLTATPIPAE